MCSAASAHVLRNSNFQMDQEEIKSLVVQVEVLGRALASAEEEVTSCRYSESRITESFTLRLEGPVVR
jgi:hypothetical protein